MGGMNKNQQIGMAALPIIIGGVVVAGLLITAVWMSGDSPNPEESTDTANEAPATPPEPAKSRIVWGSISPGVYARTVSSKASASEKVQIGGSGTTALKIESSNSKLAISLKGPDGQVISITDANAAGVTMSKITDTATGKTAYTFQIENAGAANTEAEGWEVVVNNQNTNSPTTYDLTVSDSSLVNTQTNDSSISNTQSGDTSATLSITVTETISIGVEVPILNADVTATVTDPNGNTTTVDLIENPNDPGNYSGTFDSITTPGTYDVTYNISGINADGVPFDQIVNDQFTVPDPNATAPTNTGVGTDKKYDINQSGDITPVQ